MTPFHRINCKSLAAISGLSLFLWALPAWAYLDPSTGSMILSAIVGLFATLALAVKTYWYKLKSLFRRDSQQESAAIDEPSAEPESSADL
jgi:hypothetical protein